MFSKLSKTLCAALTLALVPVTAGFAAESGFYAGGSVGTAAVEFSLGDLDEGLTVPDFDEDDFAWKVFGGYTFPIPVIDLGVEAGYVNFGGPSTDVTFPEGSVGLDADVTGFDVFGVVGFGLGPLDVFGKVGFVNWDADLTASINLTDFPDLSGSESVGDDGTDAAYGIGARINLGSIEVRGEYEIFDIDPDISADLSMWSVGLVWHFN